ncbi:MAG: 4-hydroxy-tetrahydrodipicolinate synthase [Planctomycetota bacterium]|jgi:4-hydroxy-tetrahydrodipicolinate synthase
MRGKPIQDVVRGSLVALPTPFRNGQVDELVFISEIERHARSGTRGIVVAGTTGESATLSEDEKVRLFITAVRAADGRLAVIAGVGTPDTRSTLRLAIAAERAGADAVLAVTPYYNRPSPAGLRAHYDALADAIPKLPVVLYNVPARTGINLSVELAADLSARHENIVALKDATTCLDRIDALAAIPGLDLLCGEDALLFEFLARGAVGAISVVGNVAPEETAELIGLAALDPHAPRMRELERELSALIHALHLETNPAPIKAMLNELVGFPEELRLPLMGVTAESRALILQALATVRETAPA